MGNYISYREEGKEKSESIEMIMEDFEHALENDEHREFLTTKLLSKLSITDRDDDNEKSENQKIINQFKSKLSFIRAFGRIIIKTWEITLTDYDNSIAAFIFHLARMDTCFLETVVVKSSTPVTDPRDQKAKIIMLCFILTLLKYGPRTVIFEDKQSAVFIDVQSRRMYSKINGVNMNLINGIERACSVNCIRFCSDWIVIRESDSPLTLSVHSKGEISNKGTAGYGVDEKEEEERDWNSQMKPKFDELVEQDKINRIRELAVLNADVRYNRINRVLITDGDKTEIYDIDKRVFVEGPSMKYPRTRHCSVTLRDGTVFICGGCDPVTGDLVKPCEIFSPKTMDFSEVCTLWTPRIDAAAVLLKDWRVLIVGGFIDRECSKATATAEIYNGSTRVCSKCTHELPTKQGILGMITTDGIAGMTISRHPDDTHALIVGGQTGFWKTLERVNGVPREKIISYPVTRTFLYNPETGKFRVNRNSDTDSNVELNNGMSGHRAETLSNGKVLFLGGGIDFKRTPHTLLFDWNPNKFIGSNGRMIKPRSRFFSAHIGDNEILIGGGCDIVQEEDQEAGEGEGEITTFRKTEIYNTITGQSRLGPSLIRNHNYTSASPYYLTGTEKETERELLFESMNSNQNQNQNQNQNMNFILGDIGMEGID
jgi:hypothetical protein